MASNSSDQSTEKQGEAERERSPLPFEPKRRKPAAKAPKKSPPAPATQPASNRAPSRPATTTTIPDVVSKRMVRRMALFCGIPTVLGLSSFVVSYFAVSHGVELPNTAVLLVSLGWFGLGVLGLSYGVLSASWDEELPGGWLGVKEFRTNLRRMLSAWRESRQSRSSNS